MNNQPIVDVDDSWQHMIDTIDAFTRAVQQAAESCRLLVDEMHATRLRRLSAAAPGGCRARRVGCLADQAGAQ